MILEKMALKGQVASFQASELEASKVACAYTHLVNFIVLLR
jgi:hypothetical protein